jgi:nitrogen fixation protein FixH
MIDNRGAARPRELTGRMVLIMLVSFFGVVFAVNFLMMRVASSTFGGVEVSSSYKAGLNFKQDMAAAQAQEALGWTVDAKLGRIVDGKSELQVSVRGPDGAPVPALALQARLVHPADERRDHAIAMRNIAPGVFVGATEADPAQWDLVIDIDRDGARLFRSKSRVALK